MDECERLNRLLIHDHFERVQAQLMFIFGKECESVNQGILRLGLALDFLYLLILVLTGWKAIQTLIKCKHQKLSSENAGVGFAMNTEAAVNLHPGMRNKTNTFKHCF